MNNLTHWNPFKSLARLDAASSFGDFARNFGLRPAWREFDLSPELRIDINEDDQIYRVKAEIPGVDKKDIDVSIDGNQVSISAEAKRETTRNEKEKEIHTERYYGKVYRSFSLPAGLDGAKAEARYDNGVLTLKLPKKAGTNGGKKISVS